MTMLKIFKEFIQDPDGWEMFVTGPAGSGKTTDLAHSVRYCINNEIDYVVCAYTHDACDILRSKLPEGANVCTLHSFLTKRPTINEHAKEIMHLESNSIQGVSEKYDVLFLDEYSQIGEKDYADIGLLQDPGYEGEIALRVVYIGDSNQLPPIGDTAAIYPSGKYQVKLTKIHRVANDSPLKDTVSILVNLIEGGEFKGLPEHACFKRNKDLVVAYYNEITKDKILLAWTNQRVEELNRAIAEKEVPDRNDDLYSPTTKKPYTFLNTVASDSIGEISRSYNNDPLGLGSKYKTLEHLLKMPGIEFYEVIGEELDDTQIFAVVFGHYQYKIKLQELANAAVNANKEIEVRKGSNAKEWAIANKHHKLARARAKAWRDYLTFKECVVCMDFPYAKTVHKSQGSTYNTVLVDTEDLYKCAARDYQLYLKLMYVAISRASHRVITS